MKIVDTSANLESACYGFTRLDLLVTVLTLVLVTFTLLPALARTHVNSQGAGCLNNLRQLSLAWIMYADDSNGKLAPNRGAFPPNPDYNLYPRWVAGDMRGGSIEPGVLDATNNSILRDAKYSLLAPYVKNPAFFKCPADLSTWTGVPRVRSYSMNCAVGSAINGTEQDPGHDAIGHWLTAGSDAGPWRLYFKKSDLTGKLGAADLLLLVDEHPDSINDASFSVYIPKNPADTTHWVDVPTKVHNNAANLSFADGHVETHLWQIPQDIPPLIWAADTFPGTGNEGPLHNANQDIIWVAHHTTASATGSVAPYQP